MNRRLLSIILFGMSLSFGSCEFDNDVQYIPEPIAAYWLIEDEQDSALSLLKILADDALLWNYETSLGFTANEISDMDLWGNELALGNANEQKILTFGLPDEELLATNNTSPLNPHFLALGETRLAAVDTSAHKIIWINREDGSMITDTLEGRVEGLHYMTPYFFLLEDSIRLKVWEENTLSLVENTLFPAPVDEIIRRELISRIQFISVEGAVNTLYSWDFGPQVLEVIGPVAFNKIEHSPYRRQETGREWLVSVELRGDALPRPGIKPVENYSTDFFSAQLYYQDRDSLWGVDLPTQVERFLAPFPYQVKQSRFYP
ncbi:MAG: hypothetical protein AB8H47_25765 [Bacteroidia bacterium]